MPEVTVDVGFTEPSSTLDENAAAVNHSTTTDIDGTVFDPEQHAVDADGNPKLTAAKRFAKKRGRKGGGESQLKTERPVDHRADSRAAGVGAANLFIALGMMVSPDFAPVIDQKQGINEKAMLESAFGDYFAAKEMGDLPPGLALTAALLFYVAPRLSAPTTRTRVSRFKNWVGSKVLAWRSRKNKAQEVRELEKQKKDAKEDK